MQHTQFILFVFLIPQFLFAQQKSEQQVRELFDQPSSVQWVESYDGRIDDMSQINILLGTDGTTYKGYLRYTNSGDEFRLEGTKNDSIIILNEWDATDRKTATMLVQLDNQKLRADWMNHNARIGAQIIAQVSHSSDAKPSFCGDNKWINRYTAKLGNAPIQLILSRTNNGYIWGSLWMEAEQLYFDLRGKILEDGRFDARLTSHQKKGAKGKLYGSLSDKKSIKATLKTRQKGETSISFSLVENMMVGCRTSADYTSSYDIIFPKTKCNTCNSFIEKQINQWLSECKSSTQSKKISANPDTRAALRASCWSAIHLWDDRYISGLLLFSNTWDSTTQIQAFTFDTKENKALSPNDFFVKKFNYRSWLEAFAKKESPKLRHWDNMDYRQWVKKSKFPILTMRQDGLLLSTTFHPIYGRAEIVVPWSAVKPYLQKAAIRDLVEG